MMSQKLFLCAGFCTAVAASVPVSAIAQTPSAQDLMLDESAPRQSEAYTHMQAEAPVEIAQRRRREPATPAAASSDFIGIGANFGYVEDVSGVIISKFSIANNWAVRPSVSIGDDIAVLAPVTYEFNSSANVGGAQLSPYVGAGISWADEHNRDGNADVSDVHILVSAGVDVPISRRFTLNAQANLGLLNETEFGGTVGIGYNIGSVLR